MPSQREKRLTNVIRLFHALFLDTPASSRALGKYNFELVFLKGQRVFNRDYEEIREHMELRGITIQKSSRSAEDLVLELHVPETANLTDLYVLVYLP